MPSEHAQPLTNTKTLPPMLELRCNGCSRFIHSDKYSHKILIGDAFYIYSCPACSRTGESFERLPMSWANLIQLVLYHLWVGGEKKHRYFRWKEDICGLIDAQWNNLIPSKTKGSTWHNSVSSVLSSNDRIFASGVAIKGAAGWWSLHHWEPPTPPRKLLNLKRSYEVASAAEDQEIILSSEGESQDEKPLNIVTESENDQHHYEDLIVDESEDNEEEPVVQQDDILVDKEQENVSLDQDVLMGKDIDTSDTVDNTTPLQPSADLKQQLLERLLMMDSSLLHDAIKKAKAKKIAEIEIESRKKKTEIAEAVLPPVSLIPQDCLRTLYPYQSTLKSRLVSIPVIRASPYENDLLKKCNRVDHREIKVAARLRRKLLVRRQRRRVELGLFDLDQWMYLFLKSPETALLFDDEDILKEISADNTADNVTDKTIDITSHNFDPQSVPYIEDPSKSLYVKLTGMAALYGTCPFPIISPFSSKLLPEFIEEHPSSFSFPKIQLLNQIRQRSGDTEPLTLKYAHLRKEFVGQLNDLLSDSFWPGIDVSEALDYPDYAIIALVGLSVVGCAIFNPEGYLSYLYVRPDFQGHSLANKMLAFLLPALSQSKDLTLHVSVSNTPAMLLYQKIGFKPEEFIVNFYDKYLDHSGLGSTGSAVSNKNAFFMRLRR